MQYGSRVNGRLVPKFVDSLSTTKPSEIFEVAIEVDGLTVANENEAITQLLTLEQQFPDMKILYVDTCTEAQKIIMQFTDVGPCFISFSGVFGAIPALFMILGIAIIGYLLWQVMQTNPLLLWGLAIIGGVVAFSLLFPSQLRGLTPGPIRHPKIPTTRVGRGELTTEEKKRIRLTDQLRNLKNERIATESEGRVLREQIGKWNKDLKKAKRKKDKSLAATLERNIKDAKKRERELVKESGDINREYRRIREELKQF